VDCIILDIEPVPIPSNHVAVILGRSFLVTANAFIHFQNGIMKIYFGNMILCQSTTFRHWWYFWSWHDRESGREHLGAISFWNIVETCLLHFRDDFDWEESFEKVNALLELATLMDVGNRKPKVEPLPPSQFSSPSLPSIIEPPDLDLKPLPDTLKYVFLGTVEPSMSSDLNKK